MRINKSIKIGMVMLALVIFSSYVSAFSMGSAYHSEYPLEMYPGETKEIIFNLQNMGGTEEITARANIVKGSEILELIDDEDVALPVGASVDVRAIVSIPADAKIGTVYPIETTFTTVTKGTSGSFSFGSSVGRSFNVNVVLSSEEITKLAERKILIKNLFKIGLGIIVALIIIYVVFRKRKKK